MKEMMQGWAHKLAKNEDNKEMQERYMKILNQKTGRVEKAQQERKFSE